MMRTLNVVSGRRLAFAGATVGLIASTAIAAKAFDLSSLPVAGGGSVPPAASTAIAKSGLVPTPQAGPNFLQLQGLCKPPADPPGHEPHGDCQGTEVTLLGLCDHGVAYVCNVPDIDVQVDGAHVSALTLAQGLEKASTMLSVPTTDQRAEEAAAALAVLNETLYQESVRTGHMALRAAAEQVAQQQLQTYLSDPQPSLLPAGETPQQYFTDPDTIKAYQFALTLNTERQIVLKGAPTDSNRTPLYAQFLQMTLPTYHVVVTGTPQFSIPDSLPAGL